MQSSNFCPQCRIFTTVSYPCRFLSLQREKQSTSERAGFDSLLRVCPRIGQAWNLGLSESIEASKKALGRNRGTLQAGLTL